MLHAMSCKVYPHSLHVLIYIYMWHLRISKYQQTGSGNVTDLTIACTVQLIYISFRPNIKSFLYITDEKSMTKISKSQQTGSSSAAELEIAYTVQLTTIKLHTKYQTIPFGRSWEIHDQNFTNVFTFWKFQSLGKQEVAMQQIWK